MVSWTKQTAAPLGGVINCAGVGLPTKIIEWKEGKTTPHSLDAWNFVIGVNLTGTFNLTRLVLAHLVKVEPEGEDGERGVVIMVSSAAAVRPITATITLVFIYHYAAVRRSARPGCILCHQRSRGIHGPPYVSRSRSVRRPCGHHRTWCLRERDDRYVISQSTQESAECWEYVSCTVWEARGVRPNCELDCGMPFREWGNYSTEWCREIAR